MTALRCDFQPVSFFDSLCPAFHIHFHKEIGYVSFYGAERKEKFVGNLGIAVSPRDELQYLVLSCCEVEFFQFDFIDADRGR